MGTALHPIALEMMDAFSAKRHLAEDALMLGQHFQMQSYNWGWLALEFNEGNPVLLNLHFLSFLRNETGHGRKLLMKYDSPLELIQKLSLVSYQLRMPESYSIHPILNIAHLEKYQTTPSKFGNQPTKSLTGRTLIKLPEYKVDKIIAKRCNTGWTFDKVTWIQSR